MRPLITPLKLRLHRRHIKQAIVTSLAVSIILLALLPALLSLAIRYQLPRMGLGQAEIGNINLNPFRGRLTLEGVALYRAAARVLSVQHLELDLAMLSLLERRIHIQSLRVDGLELSVKQDVGGPLQIAGVPLPSAGTEPTAVAGSVEQTGEPWGFGIDAFAMQNSALHVIHPLFPESVQLDDISVGPLAMWRPDYPTPLSVQLGLHEGRVAITAKVRPFSQTPRHRLELVVDALPLASFARLSQPALSQLDGRLSTRMVIEVQQEEGEEMALRQQGELSLSGLQIAGEGHRLSQQGLSWNGEMNMGDLNQPETLMVNGDLKLSGVALLAADSKKPYLSLDGFSMNGIKASGTSRLELDEVVVESLQAETVRRRDGITLTGMPPLPAADGQSAMDTVAADERAVASEVEERPFNFSIGRLHLGGNSRLGFDDQTVTPPFHHTLIISQAELEQLDNSRPELPTRLSIKAKDDFYTTIDVEGETRPFAEQLSLNLKAKLQNYDMPPATPYLAQLLGYRITTGQLDSDVTLNIERNDLQGELALRMNQLQLKPEDSARIEETQAKLPLPLNTALSLLRDSDDNIQLTLPVSGKLDDPQFAIDDIINSALGKALKAGSVSYLKHLLQPYGSLITIIQLAGKASGSIQLDPVLFAPGSGELPADAAPYIERLAGLMKERSGINMQLCGFATIADLSVITKNKEKVIPAGGHPALETLAKQRAEAIKANLVGVYGVPAKQLFICHPELDGEEGAEGRVELSL